MAISPRPLRQPGEQAPEIQLNPPIGLFNICSLVISIRDCAGRAAGLGTLETRQTFGCGRFSSCVSHWVNMRTERRAFATRGKTR